MRDRSASFSDCFRPSDRAERNDGTGKRNQILSKARIVNAGVLVFGPVVCLLKQRWGQNKRQEELWGEPTTSAIEMTINNGYFFPVTGFAGCPNYLDIISAEVVLYPPTKYRKHAQCVILSFTSHASDGLESERKLNSLERLDRDREKLTLSFSLTAHYFLKVELVGGAQVLPWRGLEKPCSIRSTSFTWSQGVLVVQSVCFSYVL